MTISKKTPVTIGILITIVGAVWYAATAWGSIGERVSGLEVFRTSTAVKIEAIDERTIRIDQDMKAVKDDVKFLVGRERQRK